MVSTIEKLKKGFPNPIEMEMVMEMDNLCKKNEGKNIITHLIALYGKNKVLKNINDSIAEQLGMYKLRNGENNILIEEVPTVLMDNRFVFEEFLYVCKIRATDEFGTPTSSLVQSMILTEEQIFQLICETKKCFDIWNPLLDPEMNILKGLTIKIYASPYIETNRKYELKTSFHIMKNDVYNKIINKHNKQLDLNADQIF